MTLLESIKAVREAFERSGLCPHPVVRKALDAAESAAAAQDASDNELVANIVMLEDLRQSLIQEHEVRDAAYQRAREAWAFHRVPMMDRSLAWIGDNKEAVAILDEYFKGGE